MVNELNVLENKLFKSASYVQGYNDLLAVQNGGSLVNESNIFGLTPLYIASSKGNLEIAKVLTLP